MNEAIQINSDGLAEQGTVKSHYDPLFNYTIPVYNIRVYHTCKDRK